MDAKQLVRKITRYKEAADCPHPPENFRPLMEKDLQDVDLDLFEERAAIIQFEGGFTKEQAEYLALGDDAISRSILINRRKRLFRPRAGSPASKEFVRENVMDKLNELKKISSSVTQKSALFSTSRTKAEPGELPGSVKDSFRNRFGKNISDKGRSRPSPLHMEIGDYSNIPF